MPRVDISISSADSVELSELKDFLQPYVEAGILLPRTFEELRDLVQHGFIAETEGKIVGFVALEIYSSKLAEVRSLAVSREYRQQGLGRELVSRCVQLATEKNILEVMAISSAEEFLRSCGFDFTLPGEKKAFFLQTRENIVPRDHDDSFDNS